MSGTLADGARVSIGAWARATNVYAATALFEYGSELVDPLGADGAAFVDGVFYVGLARGGVAHPMTAPPPFPTVPPVYPGYGPLVVPAGTAVTLTSTASYDGITVQTGATLYLATGAHQVGSIATSTNASIVALGAVDLRIADALVLGADSVLTGTTGLTAGDVRVDVLGFNSPPEPLSTIRAVDLGDRTTTRMILSAPNATTRIGVDATLTGAVLAGDVLVDFGATVAFEDGRDPFASDAPVAYSDSAVVSEDDTLSVAVPGVLWNDYDPNGDALTAELVSGTTSGTVSLSADGSYVYTPSLDYSGVDAFTYRVTDGALYSQTATVTITVDSENDAPRIVSEPDRTTFIGALWSYAIQATDADTDDVLTYALEPGAPSGMTIGSATGLVSWTPGTGDDGTHASACASPTAQACSMFRLEPSK